MPDQLTPMTDADVVPASATADSSPPLKNAGDERTGTADKAREVVRENAGKLGQQATDKLRMVADDGKARAGGALDQVAQLLTDAATQVDDKLGEQYGRYARDAAGQVQGFADTVRNKDVNELIDDARAFVRASPAVAIGVAAALGFAAARLVQAGVDDARA